MAGHDAVQHVGTKRWEVARWHADLLGGQIAFCMPPGDEIGKTISEGVARQGPPPAATG